MHCLHHRHHCRRRMHHHSTASMNSFSSCLDKLQRPLLPPRRSQKDSGRNSKRLQITTTAKVQPSHNHVGRRGEGGKGKTKKNMTPNDGTQRLIVGRHQKKQEIKRPLTFVYPAPLQGRHKLNPSPTHPSPSHPASLQYDIAEDFRRTSRDANNMSLPDTPSPILTRYCQDTLGHALGYTLRYTLGYTGTLRYTPGS